MKIKSRQDAISFYNDAGVLIASFNKFYNKIYTGKYLHVGELEEIKKYLDKQKHKAYTVFGITELLADDGEDLEVIEEDIEETEIKVAEKPKRKRRTKAEIEAAKAEMEAAKKAEINTAKVELEAAKAKTTKAETKTAKTKEVKKKRGRKS